MNIHMNEFHNVGICDNMTLLVVKEQLTHLRIKKSMRRDAKIHYHGG
jgi:hypothetical protein